MVRFNIRLAKKVISVEALYESTREFCRDYIVASSEADISVSLNPADISAEQRKSADERRLEGLEPYEFPKEYLETLALYRKIAEAFAPLGVILFHGSSISMDGDGYIFTAKSGTGKSTHTRIWRKVFGERVVMINDDKPLISISEKGATVYGTPWCGKHGLGANISAPIKGIAVLERGEKNSIAHLPRTEAFPRLLVQTFRPRNADALRCVLSLVDKLSASVPVYLMRANMELDAAETAYHGMKKG